LLSTTLDGAAADPPPSYHSTKTAALNTAGVVTDAETHDVPETVVDPTVLTLTDGAVIGLDQTAVFG
jgi:hypothetical protein